MKGSYLTAGTAVNAVTGSTRPGSRTKRTRHAREVLGEYAISLANFDDRLVTVRFLGRSSA